MNHRNWFFSWVTTLHNLGGLRRGTLLLAAAVCLFATPAVAQLGYTVNNTGDPGTGTATNCPVNSSASGPGTCTLRDALAAANASASSAQGATIVFDPSLTASDAADIRFCIGCGPYLVNNYIAIIGPSSGHPVEIDGFFTDLSGVSMLFDETGGSLVLSGKLIFMNGAGTEAYPGGAGGGGQAGGIEIDGGSLIATGVTFQNNLGLSGGAIYNNSNASIGGNPTVTVNNCSFIFNSTGITSNQGSLLVQNSTFSENAAALVSGSPVTGEAAGGILANNTVVTVQNSSFLNNSNNNNGQAGGAIALTGDPGVANIGVSGSTFAYNSAVAEGGAAYIGQGLAAWFTNDTFYANSVQTYPNTITDQGGAAGIFADSNSDLSLQQLTMQDTNSGPGLYDDTLAYGNLSVVNSLIYGEVIYAGTVNATGNVWNSSTPISALGNYGGPTQTMMPMPQGNTVSAVICGGATTNLGNDATGGGITLPSTDQRGYARIGDNHGSPCVDVGAVQSAYSLQWIASPSNPQVGGATMTATSAPTYPTVQLLEHNNVIALAGAIIPAALTTGTLGGTITATTAPNGVATFNALTSPVVTTPISGDQLFAGLYIGPGPSPGDTNWGNYPSTPFDITDLTLPPTTLASGTVGTVYSQIINPATGGEGTIAYAVTGGALPNGLNLNSSSGAITGIPTAAAPSGASFTITATDSDGDTATQLYSISIAKGTPIVSWATPAAIAYGTALSGTQLNATASLDESNIPGNFNYTPPSGTVLTAGTQTLSVLFTPTDTADYTTATQTVQLQVNKATPLITWATPTAITYGTALSATQLNATASSSGSSVPGNFTYTPPSGTILTPGNQTLSVAFAPTDTTDYNNASQTVTLVVNKATPAVKISLTAGSNPVFQGNSVTFTATVSFSSSAGPVATPTGSVSFLVGSSSLCATVNLTAGAAPCTTNTLAQGADVITASYTGDSNYNPVAAAASTSLTETVMGLILTPLQNALTVIPGQAAVYSITVGTTPSGSPTTFPAPVTFTVTCGSCAGGAFPAGITAGLNLTSLSSTGTLVLTLQTTNVASLSPSNIRPGSASRFGPLALALLLLPFARRLRRTGRRLSQIGLALLLAVVSLAVATGISGCGSTVGFFGQAQQSYSVVVTATSGSYTDTTTVSVTVE